jgi:hypothetical protein
VLIISIIKTNTMKAPETFLLPIRLKTVLPKQLTSLTSGKVLRTEKQDLLVSSDFHAPKNEEDGQTTVGKRMASWVIHQKTQTEYHSYTSSGG